MSDQGSDNIRFSKDELLRRIAQAFTALEETIAPLNNEQLSRPGPEGWAIKDHLAHMAAWELGIAELLQGRDRFAAMGVGEAVQQGLSEEEINDRIYRRHAQLTALEARQVFHEAHQKMMQALEILTEADLQKPYAAYMPGSTQPHHQNPVWHSVVGNTNGHFEEHTGYIRSLLEGQVD